MTREKALALRALLVKASASLSDADASIAPELFPQMAYDGSLIEYQTRINWRGTVKMARQDIWATEQNDPDHAPNLWADLDYKDGYRYIHETITAEEAFAQGEKGWWKDRLYESIIPANVHNPEPHPDGWRLAE